VTPVTCVYSLGRSRTDFDIHLILGTCSFQLFSRPSFHTATSLTSGSVIWVRINYSSCESDGTESAPSARGSTCFQINLGIKMIYCSSIICLEMWKSDTLCTHTFFFHSHVNFSSNAPSYRFPYALPLT